MSLNKAVTELTELNNSKCINRLDSISVFTKHIIISSRNLWMCLEDLKKDNHKFKLKCEAYKKISKSHQWGKINTGQRTDWILQNPRKESFKALWTQRARMQFTLHINNTDQKNIFIGRGSKDQCFTFL